jgi:hypothetical protein
MPSRVVVKCMVQLFNFWNGYFPPSKRCEDLNYIPLILGTQILDLQVFIFAGKYITSLKCTVYNLSCITRLGVAKQLSSVSGSGAIHLYRKPPQHHLHSLLPPSILFWIVTSSSNIYSDPMPRKPRSKPLRQHYTRDLKRRVIYQAEVLGYSSTKIAIELSMPLTVVQRVRRTWSEIGEVCQDRKYKGRAPMMSTAAVSVSLHSPCLLA